MSFWVEQRFSAAASAFLNFDKGGAKRRCDP
jgi:hypothetical protein